MHVAHCISGDAREFIIPSVHTHILKYLVTSNNNSKVFFVIGVGFCHGNSFTCKIEQNTSISSVSHILYNFPNMKYENAQHFVKFHVHQNKKHVKHNCNIGSRRPSSGYWQWQKVMEVYQLAKNYEQLYKYKFDLFVRSRPDLYYSKPIYLQSFSYDKITVHHSRNTYVSDYFAVVPRKFADVYFQTIYSYFRCRDCTFYNYTCSLRTCFWSNASIRQTHVSSECLLNAWLQEHSVPVTSRIISGQIARNIQKVNINFDNSERYANLVYCKSSMFLVTRKANNRKWETVVRNMKKQEEIIISSYYNISHNTAAICIKNKLVLFGGRQNTFEHGIHKLMIDTDTNSIVAYEKVNIPKCMDQRSFLGGCEFDGKLHVVYFNRLYFLFARANVRKKGGRHVQVSTSVDTTKWSTFRLLEIKGVEHKQENNVYFMAVSTERTKDGSERLWGIFPAAINNTGGVWISSSTNGFEWSFPTLFMKSNILDDWRTNDHPVSFIVRRKSIQSYILRYVRLDYEFEKGSSPILCKYERYLMDTI
jgi:hypothetical protein